MKKFLIFIKPNRMCKILAEIIVTVQMAKVLNVLLFLFRPQFVFDAFRLISGSFQCSEGSYACLRHIS